MGWHQYTTSSNSMTLESNKSDNSYGVSETARRLGINAKLLGRWKREAEARANGAVTDNGQVSPESDELRRLRKEIQRLRMERDKKKKTVIFFANESN